MCRHVGRRLQAGFFPVILAEDRADFHLFSLLAKDADFPPDSLPHPPSLPSSPPTHSHSGLPNPTAAGLCRGTGTGEGDTTQPSSIRGGHQLGTASAWPLLSGGHSKNSSHNTRLVGSQKAGLRPISDCQGLTHFKMPVGAVHTANLQEKGVPGKNATRGHSSTQSFKRKYLLLLIAGHWLKGGWGETNSCKQCKI